MKKLIVLTLALSAPLNAGLWDYFGGKSAPKRDLRGAYVAEETMLGALDKNRQSKGGLAKEEAVRCPSCLDEELISQGPKRWVKPICCNRKNPVHVECLLGWLNSDLGENTKKCLGCNQSCRLGGEIRTKLADKEKVFDLINSGVVLIKDGEQWEMLKHRAKRTLESAQYQVKNTLDKQFIACLGVSIALFEYSGVIKSSHGDKVAFASRIQFWCTIYPFLWLAVSRFVNGPTPVPNPVQTVKDSILGTCIVLAYAGLTCPSQSRALIKDLYHVLKKRYCN